MLASTCTVDDLHQLDDLERHIDESACVLAFLSMGYLLSGNCLREIRRGVYMRKPLSLIWEADPAKGGATIAHLRDDECPSDLTEIIFSDEGKMYQWHRFADFQLVSLKRVAESLLLASPAYHHKRSIDLVMNGELQLCDRMRLPPGTHVVVSPNNPGAKSIAFELERYFSKLIIVDEVPTEKHIRERTTRNVLCHQVYFLVYLSKSTFFGPSGV